MMHVGTTTSFKQPASVASALEQPSLFAPGVVGAKPFLKWAGGKRQLLPVLLPRIPSLRTSRYHEPFVGGGALFFALADQHRLGAGGACLSDVNADLINAYQMVRDHVGPLMAALRVHKPDEESYYRVRAQQPSTLDPIERAARLIYLNKTCFNGLFRENQKGQFNVPYGRYANPMICDEKTLLAAHTALQGVALEVASFEQVLVTAQPGDFVYFDPPYAPLSKTASFVGYHAGGFDEQMHIRLAEVVEQLAENGVNVMLSNSSVEWIRALYRPFWVEEVRATRHINSRADKRGCVQELLAHAGPYVRFFGGAQQGTGWHLGESNPEPYAYEASALTD